MIQSQSTNKLLITTSFSKMEYKQLMQQCKSIKDAIQCEQVGTEKYHQLMTMLNKTSQQIHQPNGRSVTKIKYADNGTIQTT